MMRTLPEFFAAGRSWCERGIVAGWFEAGVMAQFDALEQRLPSDLFAGGEARPLVVAFFGGTGVGKSSLLNRLAGAAIARTGVVRPTSREVTLYLHESVTLAALPADAPLHQVVVQRHRDERRRGVAWIDAPDINSVDEENRRLALAWLPFVDMLIYVVSPERYRDDVGWRVLQERAERHGWMFVVNRWDEGSSEQPRDFETILQRAGFERPVVLCTCGIEDLRRRPERDDFPRIESTIQRLLAEHGQQELERLGHRARLLDLHEFVKGAQQALGTAEQWQALEREAARLWSAATDSICAGLAPDQRVAAERLAAIVQPESRPVLEQVRAAVTPLLVKETSRPTASLTLSVDAELAALAEQAWPLWAQERAAEFLDGIDVAAAHAGLRSPPLRVALQPVVTDLATEVSRATERAAREALAPAGIPWRHGARRAAGFLTKAGPVAVLIWIAVLAFLGFYRATLGATGWLGTDFAVHAAVLLLISWGLPLAVWWWLRPDAGPALFSSQQRALRRVLEQQWGAARAALAAAAQSAGSLAQEVDALKADIERFVQRGAASTAPGIAPLVSTGIKEKV